MRVNGVNGVLIGILEAWRCFVRLVGIISQ